MAQAKKEKSNAPYQIKMGSLVAKVFEKEGEYGTFYNVEIVRRFQQVDDKHDGPKWRETPNFSLDQLPVVATLAEKATDYILGKAGK